MEGQEEEVETCSRTAATLATSSSKPSSLPMITELQEGQEGRFLPSTFLLTTSALSLHPEHTWRQRGQYYSQEI